MPKREVASDALDAEDGVVVGGSTQRAANLYVALMEAAPHEPLEPTRADRFPLRDLIEDALERLDSWEREVFNACVVERKSIRHIARDAGVSRSHVFRTKNRAIGKLQLLLEREPEIRRYLLDG